MPHVSSAHEFPVTKKPRVGLLIQGDDQDDLPLAKKPRVTNPKDGNKKTNSQRDFMRHIFEQIDDHLFADDTDKPVIKLASPQEIADAVKPEIGEKPRSHDELLQSCKAVFEYSARTNHKHFHNQLFASCKAEAIAGEFITAASNASMYTYEVAPVYSVLEKSIFTKMHGLCGWTSGDGIFCPGGSMSNFYGMNLARYKACKDRDIDVKMKGMRAVPHLVAFVSSHGHYSVKKAAAFLGIGVENVIEVAADAQGAMVISDFEVKIDAAVAAGQVPFFVQATAATTVLGGYDNINKICDVCERHKIWVHIDGCWGGSVMLSPEHRHLVAGIERADSVAWNPHKMMGIPLQCAAFIVRHDHILHEAHAYGAKYLFQKDKLNTNLDTGDKSVQCGRKVDVLKLWLAWAVEGDEGYRQHVNTFMATAQHLKNEVTRRDPFLLVAEPMCSNVCFWFMPPSIRGSGGPAPHSPEWKEKVHTAAATIKQRMQEKGSLMVGFQSIPLAEHPSPANFFRMVVMSEKSCPADMDFLLNEIEALGQDL